MNSFVVFKRESEEQRIVWGEVYAPNRPDSDGEFMDAETIRQMSYSFMLSRKLDQIDHQHKNQLTEGVGVVESFIARDNDQDFIPGSWVVGVHIPDDGMWDKVQKGEINGFSIEALVNKHPVNVEVDLPPQVNGMTLKADDGHVHAFQVTYDTFGKFLGGTTSASKVDGHTHAILRGTITEATNGHRHRFSHLENITLREVA